MLKMNRHGRRTDAQTTGTGRRTKHTLVPAPRQVGNHISLVIHLALAACSCGKGNAHLLNELIRANYIAYHVRCAGFGAAEIDVFVEAQSYLEAAASNAARTGIWTLDEEGVSCVAKVLAVHDNQLSGALAWMLIEANEQFERSLARGRRPVIV